MYKCTVLFGNRKFVTRSHRLSKVTRNSLSPIPESPTWSQRDTKTGKSGRKGIESGVEEVDEVSFLEVKVNTPKSRSKTKYFFLKLLTTGVVVHLQYNWQSYGQTK